MGKGTATVTDHKMIDVLWLDSTAQLSPAEVTSFAEQGLAVTQAGAEPDNVELFGAQLVVVSLTESTQCLKDIQSRLSAVNSSAPIIARVERSNFELGHSRHARRRADVSFPVRTSTAASGAMFWNWRSAGRKKTVPSRPLCLPIR